MGLGPLGYGLVLDSRRTNGLITWIEISTVKMTLVQGYLVHKKTPAPLGPPYDPRHRPTVGS